MLVGAVNARLSYCFASWRLGHKSTHVCWPPPVFWMVWELCYCLTLGFLLLVVSKRVEGACVCWPPPLSLSKLAGKASVFWGKLQLCVVSCFSLFSGAWQFPLQGCPAGLLSVPLLFFLYFFMCACAQLWSFNHSYFGLSCGRFLLYVNSWAFRALGLYLVLFCLLGLLFLVG